MDHGACNVLYLDRRAREEHILRDPSGSPTTASRKSSDAPGYFKLDGTSAEVQATTDAILSIFSEVYIFRSGASCLAKLVELSRASERIPTILLIDLPYDEEQRLKRISRERRTTPSPTRSLKRTTTDSIELDDIYGIHLLTHISAEIQSNNLSKLVVPVVVLSGFEREWASPTIPSPSLHGSQVLTDTVRLVRYLDCGAVDVLTSPLSRDQVHGLAVHAYRAYKEVAREDSSFLSASVKRVRKTSWVGIEEAKPYAYLREAMVSTLMNGIINPENTAELINPIDVEIEPDRRAAVAKALGTWSFSAHDLSDDELLYACLLMLQHALKMPELEKWRITTAELMKFLLNCRAAYNNFVLYHNFRHVADVLQAVFFFLLQIGSLPSYPDGSKSEPPPSCALATLIKPFDALTLLVSAIGHDVGHPGVNNAFLVALNAPLAQLYNDRSVLESFHCAAYSQILRRHWPVAFQDCSMRKLMINSILATDMGLHFKYMVDLGNLQEKLEHNDRSLEGWNLKQLEEYRDLICGLLIKCADISNVARKYDVAAQWASILTDEFIKQGDMEKDLEMQTCLFGGPPVRDDIIKLAESQIGFMNIFARPLFEGVTDILPAMGFSIHELNQNKSTWEQKIEDEKLRTFRGPNGAPLRNPADLDALPSPMSKTESELRFPGGPKSLPNSEPLAPAPTRLSTSSSRQSNSLDNTADTDDSSRRTSGTHNTSTPQSAGETDVKSTSTQNLSHSRRGSAGDNASLTTILVTQNPPAPSASEKKKRNKGEVGCSPRLRSLSPSKRKQRPEREGQDQTTPRKDSTLLGRRYASHSDLSSRNGARQLPSPHSPSNTSRFAQHTQRSPNGDIDPTPESRRPHTRNGEVGKPDYHASGLSRSSNDLRSDKSDDNPGKKANKFSRFWKKRWRGAKDEPPVPPLPKDLSRDLSSKGDSREDVRAS